MDSNDVDEDDDDGWFVLVIYTARYASVGLFVSNIICDAPHLYAFVSLN